MSDLNLEQLDIFLCKDHQDHALSLCMPIHFMHVFTLWMQTPMNNIFNSYNISSLPYRISRVIEKYGSGNWLDEIRRFFNVKKKVYEELMAMSPKYYWYVNNI